MAEEKVQENKEPTEGSKIEPMKKGSKAWIWIVVIIVGIILLVIGGFVLAGIFAWNDSDSETIIETREVESFTEIELRGGATLDIVQGNEQSMEIEASQEALSELVTEVKNDKLIIKTKRPWYKWLMSLEKSNVSISIVVPDLNVLEIDGSCDLSTGPLTADTFEVNVDGAIDGQLSVLAVNLVIDISGSGDLKIDGAATNQEYKISGSGDIDASGLKGETAEIEISGSGEVLVDVTESLDVKISGSGDVTYTGNPSVDQSISGSGNIHKK